MTRAEPASARASRLDEGAAHGYLPGNQAEISAAWPPCQGSQRTCLTSGWERAPDHAAWISQLRNSSQTPSHISFKSNLHPMSVHRESLPLISRSRSQTSTLFVGFLRLLHVPRFDSNAQACGSRSAHVAAHLRLTAYQPGREHQYVSKSSGTQDPAANHSCKYRWLHAPATKTPNKLLSAGNTQDFHSTGIQQAVGQLVSSSMSPRSRAAICSASR